jgi:hypothetical protein
MLNWDMKRSGTYFMVLSDYLLGGIEENYNNIRFKKGSNPDAPCAMREC